MPFTASNTDVWTIAASRDASGGGGAAVSSAPTMVRFQSVTTLAPAAAGTTNTIVATVASASFLNIRCLLSLEKGTLVRRPRPSGGPCARLNCSHRPQSGGDRRLRRDATPVT